MEFTFTNNTLNNLLKEAKKLTKSSSIELNVAKNKIAINLGFKSYHDICKYFYEWLNLEQVVVIFKKGDIGNYSYEKEEYGVDVDRKLTIEDINHTKNYGLKLLVIDDTIEFLKKYKYLKHIENRIEDYVLFEMVSARFDLDKLKKESAEIWNNHCDGHPGFKYYSKEMLDDFIERKFYNNLPYKIDSKLKQLRPINSYYYEDTMFNPQYFLIEGRSLNAIDLHDEIMYP